MKTDPWDDITCDWHEAPDERSLTNAAHLVTAARAAGIPPEGAATGKLLSACLFWDGGRTEVEVFEDRYELYFLPKSREDGDFDVEHLSVDDSSTLATLIEKIREARATLRR